MNDASFQIFLKTLQIKPLQQAFDRDDPKFLGYISDNVVYTSGWLAREGVTLKAANGAIAAVIFKGSVSK